MEKENLEGRVCYITGDWEAYEKLLVWPFGRHEMTGLARMSESLAPALKEHRCVLAACEIEDWNGELTPWEALAVFGKEGFKGRGKETLKWLVQDCIGHFQKECMGRKEEVKLLIGGYSLAGLFSLWAFHETGLFCGASSCSGSLWYPGFIEYVKGTEALAQNSKKPASIYLSLGDREAKNKNPVLSTIKECTEELYAYYADRADIRAVLEWNPGGHFTEPERRLQRGFCWLLENTV